jgi:hypothetical protein
MTGPSLHLDGPSVEAIACRVVELLRGERLADELLDTAEVARRFNVSRDFVYRHATELGAIRLGDGLRARLRFSLATVAERLAADSVPPPKPTRPRRREAHGAVELLPIRQSKVQDR